MSITTRGGQFQVVSSAACMPNNCWGIYRRVGVVEMNPDSHGNDVSMLAERARGVRRVVQTWERLNVGFSDRCAYRRALAEAEKLAEALNAGD